MKNKVWDIITPKDNWERHFAFMNYQWLGLHIMLTGKEIEVSYE